MIKKGIRKNSKERYSAARPSLVSDYAQNSKFIPFFTNGLNKDDWRIAYFIAHLRDEVNRHKGSLMSYGPSKRVIRTINATPDTPTFDAYLATKGITDPSVKNPLSRNIFEIDYIGNIRFLTIPGSMKEDSPLYENWLTFFCDLKAYLNGAALHADSLNFIKTLEDKTAKKYPSEYNFAVAVVQTFLESLIITTPGTPGTPGTPASIEQILTKPEKWKDATGGTYISNDEIIFRLFAPGKIYNQRKLVSKMPPSNLTLNKYYITQKGGGLATADNVINSITTQLHALLPANMVFTHQGNETRTAIAPFLAGPEDTDFDTNYNNLLNTVGIITGMAAEITEIFDAVQADITNNATLANQPMLDGAKQELLDINNIYNTMDYFGNYAAFLGVIQAVDAFDTAGDLDTVSEAFHSFYIAMNSTIAHGGARIVDTMNFYKANVLQGGPTSTLVMALKGALDNAAVEAAAKATAEAEVARLLAALAAETGDKTNLQAQLTAALAVAAGAPGATVGDINAIKATLATLATTSAKIDKALTDAAKDAFSTSGANTRKNEIIDEVVEVGRQLMGNFEAMLGSVKITTTDPVPDGDILIDSLPTTPMFEALRLKCGPLAATHTPSLERNFATKDKDKFFRKRLNLLFAETDALLVSEKEKAKIKASTSSSIAKTFKDSGINIRGENKYTYKRVNRELKITDITTGLTLSKKDYTRPTTCKYLGFTDTDQCDRFIDSCILGTDPLACHTFLQNKDFWIRDIGHFTYNANFHAVYISLKRYDMRIETNSDGLQVLENFDTWLTRTHTAMAAGAGGTIPTEVKALLKISVEQINKHPAILNLNYSEKSPYSAETDEDDTALILFKLHKDTQAKLPKLTSQERSTGVIYKLDVIVEESQKQMKDLKMIVEHGLLTIHNELEVLKTGIEGPSINAKYFQHQQGGTLNMNSFKHYATLNQLKEELLDTDQRISNFLLQEFNNNIDELKATGTQIATENINKIRAELMKVKHIEILQKTIKYYARKFLFFFHSEFKPFLDTLELSLNPAYKSTVQQIEMTLDELFELVNRTYEKFNTYCSTGGKIESLAGICAQIGELASPQITEEITDAFRPLMNK